MEGHTAYFCSLDDIYDESRNQFDLYFGYIELKNEDNVIFNLKVDINGIYEEHKYSLDPIYRVYTSNQIPLFNNFVKNLESSGEAKLSFRQYNGEKYYGVKDNIFSIYSKDNYSGNEKHKDYIVNESLINAFKEIETIIKSNLNFFFI